AINIINKMKTDIPTYKVNFQTHQKEWERLSGIPIEEQTHERNREAVDNIGATIVLKMHGTEIYFKDSECKLPTGTPAMATGGMGDTIAGRITGLADKFNDLKEAVTSASYTHSYIGETLSDKMYVVPPSQLISEIPYAMKSLEN